jgi:hypothetical protein
MQGQPTKPTPAIPRPGATPPPPPDIQATIPQNDPALQQKVSDFIAAAGGEVSPKPKIQVPPNTDFDIPNPNDAMLTEALVSTEKITVTDIEKSLFVKALLNDEPVRFQVELLGGKLKVEMRSRTLHEQRRIFDVLNKDQSDGTIPPVQIDGKAAPDLAYQITRLNQYCMAFMIERVNGELFSDLKLTKDCSVDDAQTKLHALVNEKIEGINGIRWSALLNAMRIFETKCAKMSTEANSEDFWKPRE